MSQSVVVGFRRAFLKFTTSEPELSLVGFWFGGIITVVVPRRCKLYVIDAFAQPKGSRSTETTKQLSANLSHNPGRISRV